MEAGLWHFLNILYYFLSLSFNAPSEILVSTVTWRDVIKHPSIVVVLGGRGSGKSAVCYRVIEDFRYSLSPYVVGFPKHNRDLVPDWIGIAQLVRQLDIDIVSSADILIFKNPGMLQPKFDRPEFRDILVEARQAFQSVKDDIRRWSYVYSQDANFAGLLENELPTFWDPKLSNVYANIGEISPPKLPVKMTLEEQKQKAKELYHSGWSLSQIAKYFGVSRSTAYNWIHDYPYRK